MLTIAIIGRPNVGKSTLFNRIAGKRLALVDDTPGVTRDRKEADVHWGDLTFKLIDTAGLEDAAAETLQGRMRAQSNAAIEDADLCLFVFDARAGLTPIDTQFASMLRKSGKPTLILANKAEGRAGQSGVLDAFNLGMGEPIAVSAEHGEGMSELYQSVQRHLWEVSGDLERIVEEAGVLADEEEERAPGPLRVAVVGRPNAGKSTLINQIIGQERMLTGPEAGITRDSVSVDIVWQGRAVRLHDTAGMRKKARVVEKLEKMSVDDALRAIKFAEVVIVLLDALVPFEKQDLHIVDLIAREGRALVIAINKWDQVKDKKALSGELDEKLNRLLPQVRGVHMVQVSALSGAGLPKLLKAVFNAADIWNRRIATPKLNRWLAAAVEAHPPPAVQGRRIRLRYITQAKTRPPTFIIFSQRAPALPESYTRYLTNTIRETFSLPGTPIRMFVRKGDNPYR